MSCGKVDDIPLQVKQKGHRVTFPGKAGLLELKKETSNPSSTTASPRRLRKVSRRLRPMADHNAETPRHGRDAL
jgi:hypothetical protein